MFFGIIWKEIFGTANSLLLCMMFRDWILMMYVFIMYIMCLFIFEEIWRKSKTPFEPEPGSGSFVEILGHYDVIDVLLFFFFQYDSSTKYVRGTEDCLVVSVYTPKLPEKGQNHPLLSVFVWLHGNEFHKGQSLRDFEMNFIKI